MKYLNKNKELLEAIGAVVGVLALFVAIFAVIAWVFQTLWNVVMGDVFNLPMLTFFQASASVLLLMIVAGIIRGNTK